MAARLPVVLELKETGHGAAACVLAVHDNRPTATGRRRILEGRILIAVEDQTALFMVRGTVCRKGEEICE